MTQPSSFKLYLALAATVITVSMAAIFIRLADAPGVVVASYRMVLASLIFLPLSIRGVKRTPFTGVTLRYTVLAGVCLGVHFATWISSLTFTTVAASVTLVASQPLWVALFSWLFLASPPSFTVLLGVLTAVAGGALIGFGDLTSGSAPLLGDGLAVIGAISVAAYMLLGRAAQKRGLGLNAYVGVAYGVAALVLLPLPWLFGFDYTGYSVATYGWIVALALVPQLIGHTSLNYVMKYLNPTLVATFILLEPIGSSLMALALFKEVPSLLTLLGALILLVGVGLTIRFTDSSG